jgi:predicted HAD superfamily phosphohydrolase YqeG
VSIGRLIFALCTGWRKRQELRLCALSPLHRIATLLDLQPERLQALGADFLVLDFDGVMASHGESIPTPAVGTWLNNFLKRWPENRVAILTNKPYVIRKEFFKTHFPQILFIQGVAKKPYPEGLIQLAVQWHISPERMVLVDDRWLTGGLAALLAGTQFLYIEKPYINFMKRPFKESFFMFLRWVEKRMIRV